MVGEPLCDVGICSRVGAGEALPRLGVRQNSCYVNRKVSYNYKE